MPQSSLPTRRTVVKGAAWAVPVIALAAPAAAVTISEADPGINGWVTIRTQGSSYQGYCATISVGNNQGLWVVDTQEGMLLSEISMTIQVRAVLRPGGGSDYYRAPSFTQLGVAGDWSVPELTSTTPSTDVTGVKVWTYTTTYLPTAGGKTIPATNGRTTLSAAGLNFRACGSTVPGSPTGNFGVHRTVTITQGGAGTHTEQFCRGLCLTGQNKIGDSDENA